MLNAFTQHPIYLISALVLILFLSDWISKKPFFQPFGIALLAILIGAVFANTGLIPSGSNPTYDAVFEYIAPGGLFYCYLM